MKKSVRIPKLRSRIVRYLTIIAALFVVVILVSSMGINGIEIHNNARKDAQLFFTQMQQILSENDAELVEIRDQYYSDCENKARTAAYMIEHNPDVFYDTEGLIEIAKMIDVAELHLFDENGVLVSGTIPQYYGVTFDDGEQIAFFKPMLKDKSLCMVQEVTPNTAEQNHRQYSAVWNDGGTFIVQIGADPIAVTRVTRKNSLSHIFSLLQPGQGVSLFAIDTETGEIEGSSITGVVGKTMEEVGLPKVEMTEAIITDHGTIGGEYSYCIFSIVEDKLIAYVKTRAAMYDGTVGDMIALEAALLLIALTLVLSVAWYINRYVIRSINSINKSLTRITAGNLSEHVDERSSVEFAVLSSHINEMIRSMLGTTDVLSYVISKTDLRVGVYVYNAHMKYVRYTDYIPELLRLSAEEMQEVASDHLIFRSFIRDLKKNPVKDEPNIYRLTDGEECYIRVEEAMHNNDVLGLIVDVTREFEQRIRLESERDVDLLTGLLNRRGLKSRLNDMFESPEDLGYGALFMIDADDLKMINDTYGHTYGDRYLKKIGDVLSMFGSRKNISARLGGDEYVVFLYGYNTEADLMADVKALIMMQDMGYVALGDQDILIRFSLGYALTYGETNHTELLKEADDMMYENKRQRKEGRYSNGQR